MAQSEHRQRYRSRQAMVEPVFSQLRGRQGLQRFRRNGLSAVRAEFALHAWPTTWAGRWFWSLLQAYLAIYGID